MVQSEGVRVRTVLLLAVAVLVSPLGSYTGLFATSGHAQAVASSHPLDTVPTTVAPPVVSTDSPTASTVPPTVAVPLPPPPTVTDVAATWPVADVPSPGVHVYAVPDSPIVALVVASRTEFGNTVVLPIIGRWETWLKVRLPVRPNNAYGWIKSGDVNVSSVPDRIVVSLANRTLRWFHDGVAALEATVGVGSPQDPTPPAEYYVTDVLPSSGAYGPFIIALNGHSDALTDFEGGDPRLAIHGTDNPATIGAAASFGCVHVPNGIDRELAAAMQPGTLVEIS